MSAHSPRPLESRDLPDLARLCHEHAEFEQAPRCEPILGEGLGALLLGFDDARCYVAEGDAELAGFVVVSLERSTWDAGCYLHMDCLYLRPAYRSAGLGRLLLREAANTALELGAVNMQWQTPDWNAGAVRFYDRLGATSTRKIRFTMTPEQCARLAESDD